MLGSHDFTISVRYNGNQASSIYVCTSSIVRAFLELPLGLHSISLMQQKLEPGSDDSGCVCRIKVCSIPEIFFKQNMC